MTDEPEVRALIPSGLHRRLSRRGFLSAVTAAGVTATLAACAGGARGGTLNVYTWSDYDEPSVITDFSRRFGPRITVDSYGSNPEMIAKLAAGRGTTGYDICVPTHSAIPQMIKNNLLAKLDLDRLSNFHRLDPTVIDTKWDPGNRHSVCKDWGTTGYMYDTKKISGDPRSWADFLDLVKGDASGSVSLLEDQTEVAMTYFFAKGMNPNTTKRSELDAYRDYALKNMAPHVQKFSSSISTQVANAEQALIHAWNGDARLGNMSAKDPKRYRFVYPTEGANLWQDNWAIVRGAQNPDAAYEFIDYVLRPDISLREIEYIGYNTGVTGIRQMAEKKGVKMADLVFPSDDILKKLVYSETTSADQEIVDIYNQIVAKAGA